MALADWTDCGWQWQATKGMSAGEEEAAGTENAITDPFDGMGSYWFSFTWIFGWKVKPKTALIGSALGLSIRISLLLTVSRDLSIVFCIWSIWFDLILICWCLIGIFFGIFGIVRHYDRVLHQVSSTFLSYRPLQPLITHAGNRSASYFDIFRINNSVVRDSAFRFSTHF